MSLGFLCALKHLRSLRSIYLLFVVLCSLCVSHFCFLSTFACGTALRVHPAVTKLTVYRRPYVGFFLIICGLIEFNQWYQIGNEFAATANQCNKGPFMWATFFLENSHGLKHFFADDAFKQARVIRNSGRQVCRWWLFLSFCWVPDLECFPSCIILAALLNFVNATFSWIRFTYGTCGTYTLVGVLRIFCGFSMPFASLGCLIFLYIVDGLCNICLVF